jgi:hypothetical protein
LFFVESDLIVSLSKIADRIGHTSNLNVSNTLKKHPSTTTIKKKQQQPPKLQSSISLIVGDSNKIHKRTLEESRNVSNSTFISNNYDLTNKRHKRIGNFSFISLEETNSVRYHSASRIHESKTS